MAEQSHTPGPWVARPDYEHGPLVENPEGTIVADYTMWLLSDLEEAQANARLIAAAPELLDALDKASAAIQRLHTDVEALMADSGGVYGLHGNGDPAPWEELCEGGRFDDWIGEPLSAARRAYHDARAAIAKATGGSV